MVRYIFSSHNHFDADQLIEAMRLAGFHPRRATVYRTLAKLVDAGLLRRLDMGPRMFYEHDYGYPHHEHLHCQVCGKIIEFPRTPTSTPSSRTSAVSTTSSGPATPSSFAAPVPNASGPRSAACWTSCRGPAFKFCPRKADTTDKIVTVCAHGKGGTAHDVRNPLRLPAASFSTCPGHQLLLSGHFSRASPDPVATGPGRGGRPGPAHQRSRPRQNLAVPVLAQRLGEEVVSAFLTNSHFSSRAGFLQAILFDLSLPFEGRSEQALRLALTDYLLTQYASGKKTILIVDEAQYLTADLLEELRLLGNLEARRARRSRWCWRRNPFFSETLGLAELASFRQRLAVRLALEPMNVDEAADYLVHQLRTAGGRPQDIMADEALALLVRAAGGIPRRLNQAAHLALCLTCTAGADQVDAEAVLEALNMLDLEMPADPEAQDTDSESLEATEQTLSLPQSQPPPRTFAS